jgi:hypothetical protein
MAKVRCCVSLLTAAPLLAPATAQAASALVEWEAPDACPGASAVFERLSASLGYEPQTLGKLTRVRGDVVPSAHGYRLSLEVSESGRRSSRWLEAPSCEDLVDAAVLAITLALAPENAAQPAPPLSPAEGASSASSASAPRHAGEAHAGIDLPPRQDPGGEASAVPVRGVASLGVVTELGALPEPALGLSVSAGAHWPAWSAEAYGMLFGSQRLRPRPGQSIDFELSVAGLRGCHRWLASPWAIDSCGGVEAGRWEAFGAALQAARRSRDLWLAPVASLSGSLSLTQTLALELRAEAALPLTRKRYIINENEDVHTPSAVSWRLTAGLSIGTRGR